MNLRVVVAGGLAHHPVAAGGYAWIPLQWLLGFRGLGAEVTYIEHLDPGDCRDAAGQPARPAGSANAAWFERVLAAHAIPGGLLRRDGGAVAGLSPVEVRDRIAAADVFINLSGRWHLGAAGARRRVYVDLDPGFTQIWQAAYGVDMHLAGHDVYVTVGANLGRPVCPLPDLGLAWLHLPPPVVLEAWLPAGEPGAAYTTVADWRGYGPVQWQGRWYKQKADELLRLLELPGRVGVPLELCLAIHPDEPDLPRLRAAGWRLVDPHVHAADPDTYRAYVRASRGELSVAKHGYVAGRTGWVSDRTVCYLAAGRPAIVQDTGIGAHLPVGDGLLVFDDVASAVRALETVERRYAHHAQAARALAVEHFAAGRVLTRLLEHLA